MLPRFSEFCLLEEMTPFELRLKAVIDRIHELNITKAKNIRITDISGKKPEFGTSKQVFRIVFDVAEEDMDDVFKIRETVRNHFNRKFNAVNGKDDSSNGSCYQIKSRKPHSFMGWG